MSTIDVLAECDPELIAFLEEEGIDLAVFLARQAEMKAFRRSPEAQAEIDAAHRALAPLMEDCQRDIEQYGLRSAGLRTW